MSLKIINWTCLNRSEILFLPSNLEAVAVCHLSSANSMKTSVMTNQQCFKIWSQIQNQRLGCKFAFSKNFNRWWLVKTRTLLKTKFTLLEMQAWQVWLGLILKVICSDLRELKCWELWVKRKKLSKILIKPTWNKLTRTWNRRRKSKLNLTRELKRW